MIRNGTRPSPIHVPASNNAVHAINGLQTTSSSNTPSTIRVRKLSFETPFTPGATTTIYHEQATAYTPGPTTAIFHGRAFCLPRRVVTAWQGQFTFFNHFPSEIRERIYQYLIEDIVVVVNAIGIRTVRAFKRKPLRDHQETSPYIALPYGPVLRPNTNWLCVSRQFFFETRKVFWRCMVVKFERRWDFINAYLKGTLIADASKTIPSGMDAPILFPLKTDVMSHIQELHLNLTRGTDFGGRVTAAEATRVTMSMLEIINRDMPLLKALFFIVDDRSRLSNSIITFLPDSWFLEALLAVKHIRTVSFASGPGWQGHAQNKKHARACLCALNAVLGAHFATQHSFLKLDADGITGAELQARLGRRMLYYFHAYHHSNEAQNALAMKVVMLESNI